MKNLITALIQFQASVPLIPKTKINPFFSQGGKKSMYADLAEVIDVCKPHLNEAGLAVVQTIKVQDGRDCLNTILCHNSGEILESTIRLPEILDPQKLTAAITYLRRASYLAIVGLVADEDDDGNSVGHQQEKKQERQESSQPIGAEFPATENQKDLIKFLSKKLGKPYVEAKTFKHASDLINRLKELETERPKTAGTNTFKA